MPKKSGMKHKKTTKHIKIYLAGPLFTQAEWEFNRCLAIALQRIGYAVWLPQEKTSVGDASSTIFSKDIAGLDWCDVLVANLDGSDPDSGTSWECGYTYHKKPILAYRTDVRSITDGTGAMLNLMLTESASRPVLIAPQGIPQLAQAIHKELMQIFFGE